MSIVVPSGSGSLIRPASVCGLFLTLRLEAVTTPVVGSSLLNISSSSALDLLKGKIGEPAWVDDA